MKRNFLFLLIILIFVSCGKDDENVEAEAVAEVETETTPTPVNNPAPTPNPPIPQPTPEIIELDPDAISFEDDGHGFTARGSGSAQVQRTNEVSRAGDYALLVTGRNAPWNGATLNVTEISEPSGDYEFSLWIMPTDDAGETTFHLTVQLTLDGVQSYHRFNGATSTVTARPGVWTQMRGFLTFEAFDDAAVYVETDGAGASTDFYIDDVIFRDVSVTPAFDTSLPRMFEVYAEYFLLGTAVVPRDMNDELRFDFIRHHFNTITPGNDMKPDALQNRAGAFTWNAADAIARQTLDNNMTLVGHTLVWHEQSPDWMNRSGISREEAIANLEAHITEVVSHYRGQVLIWDVVNEAFPNSIGVGRDPTVWRAHLRETPWLEAIGDDYIEIAFRAAHAADPNAILIYNDFNLNEPRKREAVFYMVQDFLERGVPIHGIGMQAHYNLSTRPQDVEDTIQRFAELGIPVHITELDITVNDSTGQEALTPEQELQQAIRFAQLFRIFRNNSDAIARVTLWGLDDATSWRAERFPNAFNRDLSAKLAYFAIIDPDGFLAEHGAD